jgi:hypothetical protein
VLDLLFDEYAALDPEGPYWPAVADTSEDFCRAHAQVKAGPSGEIDGGYSRETDGCCHCATCGRLLAYTLTDAGAASELAHFKTVRFQRDRPLDRTTAYHLSRLIAAMPHDMEVTRIAARAIRCMRSVPTGQRGTVRT